MKATSYSNEFFSLDYVLPAGWSFSDAKALANSNSLVASAAGSDAIDMVAMFSDGETSVVVALVERGAETAGMTAEKLLQAQTDQMHSSLNGTYAYTTEDFDMTFDGMSRTLPGNITTVTENGKTLVIGQVVAEKNGNFLDVLATGSSEAAVKEAFTAFKATADLG